MGAGIVEDLIVGEVVNVEFRKPPELQARHESIEDWSAMVRERTVNTLAKAGFTPKAQQIVADVVATHVAASLRAIDATALCLAFPPSIDPALDGEEALQMAKAHAAAYGQFVAAMMQMAAKAREEITKAATVGVVATSHAHEL